MIGLFTKLKDINLNGNIKVVDFRFASVDDRVGDEFGEAKLWSRPYEYQYILDKLDELVPKGEKIHNTACGYGPYCIELRKKLQSSYSCIHSEIDFNDEGKGYSNFDYYYDVTTTDPFFTNSQSAVLNISTLEHVDYNDRLDKTVAEMANDYWGEPKDQEYVVIKSIKNLLDQLKSGGYLLLTFDYPRVKLDVLEEYLQAECEVPENLLNGSNSKFPNHDYSDLNVVYLILQKT